MTDPFIPERRQARLQTDEELLSGFDCWWDENHDSVHMRRFEPYDLCVGWLAAQGLPAVSVIRVADMWYDGRWKI